MKRALLALAALLAGCAEEGGETATRNDGGCRIAVRGLTLPEDIREGSGAAFSRTIPGVIWTHNDSGNDPELFGIDKAAREVSTLPIPLQMRDWEDIAVGPCPEGSCLYLADTGDNARKDRPLSLHVTPEPRSANSALAMPRSYTAVYPDGRVHDAEAIFVLPGGEVYLISKGAGDPIELYRWPTPLREGTPATLERVRVLAPAPEQPGDRVTGASASPDGRYVAVRTYSLLNVYRTADLVGGAAELPSPIRRTDLVPLGEAQGEGVALANDGLVALISEGQGRHVPGTLAMLQCRFE
jgi:hypothetical protein